MPESPSAPAAIRREAELAARQLFPGLEWPTVLLLVLTRMRELVEIDDLPAPASERRQQP